MIRWTLTTTVSLPEESPLQRGRFLLRVSILFSAHSTSNFTLLIRSHPSLCPCRCHVPGRQSPFSAFWLVRAGCWCASEKGNSRMTNFNFHYSPSGTATPCRSPAFSASKQNFCLLTEKVGELRVVGVNVSLHASKTHKLWIHITMTIQHQRAL